MRKYLILTSLLALTACGGGSGNLSWFGNDNDVYGKSMFAATPEKARQANASLTNMESVFDYSDRIVEIWNKSGINLDVPDSELPAILDMSGGVAQNLYDEMSDEKRLTLRKAKYIQNLLKGVRLGGPYYIIPTPQQWKDMIAYINAFYDIESKGQVTQVLDPNESVDLNDWSSVNDYLKGVVSIAIYTDWLEYNENAGMIMGFNLRVDKNTGIFKGNQDVPNANGSYYNAYYGYEESRVGDTNVFTGGNGTYTFDTFGKLSYMDYGIVTSEYSDGKTYKDAVFVADGPRATSNLLKQVKYTPETWKFAGGAVGLYYHDTTGDPDQASHTFTMQTDNATLEISGDRDTGITTVLNMPFSDWYDVKVTGNGNNFDQLEFSNYTGTAEHRPAADTGYPTIILDGSGRVFTGGDYILDPSEAAGYVYTDLDGDRFEAAFGMTRQE